jgi:hypothetical protein
VDFEGAFDSVTRTSIIKAMTIFGISEKITKLIEEMYKEYACKVEDVGGLSAPFEIKAGVRQGYLLSPVLSLIVLDIIMKAVVTKGKRGIQWNLVNKLEDLDYADDICLIAPTLQAMKGKLQALAEEAEVAGLRINTEKTTEITVNATNKERLCVYNGQRKSKTFATWVVK